MDHKECVFCGFENPVGGLREYSCHRSPTGKKLLCQVCANTPAGLANSFPDQFSHNRAVLQTVAWGINRIRKDMENYHGK